MQAWLSWVFLRMLGSMVSNEAWFLIREVFRVEVLCNLRFLKEVQRDGSLDDSTKVEEMVRPYLVVDGAGGESWCSSEGKRCSEKSFESRSCTI